jgi:hypothetical protein
MGESRNAYMILAEKPEGKKPLGRPRRRWEDKIKMILQKSVGRAWTDLAQERYTVMNLWVYKMWEYTDS